MLIGVVGAPNKGKSTFFASATLVDAQIANYPFTTISPNKGVTYVRSECPHKELGLEKCNPKNSKCINGIRLVPVNIVDIPGLVPDAHKGKGLGNQFLDSIREADVLIQVIDGTGKTDLYGNQCDYSDPEEEINFLKKEIAFWIIDIIKRNKKHTADAISQMAQSLSGLKIDENLIKKCAEECGLDLSSGLPNDEELEHLVLKIIKYRMPIVIACNKIDLPGAKETYERLKKKYEQVFPVSAAAELALRKAEQKGVIKYVPGDLEFEIIKADEKQAEALEFLKKIIKENQGTGVQKIIDFIVYTILKGIVVYPVENEHKFSNHKGEVLPDALLLKDGTTAIELANYIHTDLAKKFICAFDVKAKIKIGAEHKLKNKDIIKIVASK